MAHILPHWTWPDRVGQVTPVHVFTSGDEAELFLNGKSMGRKKKGQFEYRLRWDDVAYEPGTLEVVAYKDGKEWAKEERTGDKLDWISWTGKEFLCGGGRTTLASADGKSWQVRDFKLHGKPMWTDGTRFITSSWPGRMAFSTLPMESISIV